MKKKLKILIIVIFIILVGVFFYIKSIDVPTININNVELTNVSDGSYIGEYKTKLVKAVVKVNVEDKKITSIDIMEHKCGLGKKAEKITKEIEKSQSLDVDLISGATLSSKVILKAVQNAINKGMK
ncbi:FMN-binding protein [Haloimpatiens sp. FM7330]|uniref:FMN-binding protein n=1 Tax=Haloimpatiens sp. FM7330 TaxID=3298610 RepID=UPI003630F67B